jgi:amidase
MDLDDLHWLEITELATLLQARQVSPVEIAESMLRRIARLDPTLHAFAMLTPERALEQARRAEARLARGERIGPLDGVPIALKDLCWTQGVESAGGMMIHRDFVPSHEGTVSGRLRAAGTVMLGKLQLTEGAFADHHPMITAPVNPWHPDHWAGASSSGSGVATAAGLCFGSIGSDTGGSIRFPSIANGVTGIKPTWGRVSRFGAFELAASLDHLGPMCRSAADCGLILSAIAGPDAQDPTALQAPVPDYLAGDTGSLAGVTIGIDADYVSVGVEPEVSTSLGHAAEVLRRLGASLVPVTMPRVDQAVADWGPNCAVEAAVAHAHTFPARRSEYGPALAAFLALGQRLGGMDYQRILLRRADFTGRMNALFDAVDLLLVPGQPYAAPTVERMAALGRDAAHVAGLLRFTAPFDMSGHPTITLPSGFTGQGLPVAVQLAGGHLREDLLVRAGRSFQQATDWHARHPRV